MILSEFNMPQAVPGPLMVESEIKQSHTMPHRLAVEWWFEPASGNRSSDVLVVKHEYGSWGNQSYLIVITAQSRL